MTARSDDAEPLHQEPDLNLLNPNHDSHDQEVVEIGVQDLHQPFADPNAQTRPVIPFYIRKNRNPPRIGVAKRARLIDSSRAAEKRWNTWLEGPVPVTRMLQATLVIAFISFLTVVVGFENFSWRALFTEQMLQGPIQGTFGLNFDCLEDPILALKLAGNLFVSTGPLSLILALLLLQSTGSNIEKLGGPLVLASTFIISGIVGNATMLLFGHWTTHYFILGFGPWASLFGLVGAQASLQLSKKSTHLDFPSSTGLIGLAFRFWFFSWFFFNDAALTSAFFFFLLRLSLTCSFVGFCVASLMPARLEGKQDFKEHTGTARVLVLLCVLITAASVLFNNRVGVNVTKTKSFGFNPSKPKTAKSSNLKRVRLSKIKASVEAPDDWGIDRQTDSFAIIGPQFFGMSRQRLSLFVLSRNPYDSPDAAMGRFLALMFEDFGLSERDYALVEETPFKHPIGEAIETVFYVQQSNRYLTSGYKHAYYIVSKDHTIAFLTLNSVDDDNREVLKAVVKSFKFDKK